MDKRATDELNGAAALLRSEVGSFTKLEGKHEPCILVSEFAELLVKRLDIDAERANDIIEELYSDEWITMHRPEGHMRIGRKLRFHGEQPLYSVPSEEKQVAYGMAATVDDKVLTYLRTNTAISPETAHRISDISKSVGHDYQNVRLAVNPLGNEDRVEVSSPNTVRQAYPSQLIQIDKAAREHYLENTLGIVWVWLGVKELATLEAEAAAREQRENLRTIAEAAKAVFREPVAVDHHSSKKHPPFVHPDRLQELRNLAHQSFDFTKLVRFCEELNDNYERGNCLSVVMLGRSIMNHVPPVFGFESFDKFSAGYGKSSFKSSMKHLSGSLKNIADSYLHEPIRKKEVLPTTTQVNFSQDMDVLLGEVVRKVREGA